MDPGSNRLPVFYSLKSALTSLPVLRSPNFYLPLLVHTDASRPGHRPGHCSFPGIQWHRITSDLCEPQHAPAMCCHRCKSPGHKMGHRGTPLLPNTVPCHTCSCTISKDVASQRHKQQGNLLVSDSPGFLVLGVLEVCALQPVSDYSRLGAQGGTPNRQALLAVLRRWC